MYRELIEKYLEADSHEQPFQQRRIWTTVRTYLTYLGQCYERCVGWVELSTPTNWDLSYLGVLICRTQRAHLEQLKWVLIRQAASESSVWVELGALYRLAKQFGMAQKVTRIHRDDTPEREFLQAMMLTARKRSPPGKSFSAG